MQTLSEGGDKATPRYRERVFLELGPKPVLLGMGRQCLPEDCGIWLPSMRPGGSEWQQIFSSLGQLYVRGANIDWSEVDRDGVYQKVSLPTYPFQRERYWVEINGYSEKKYLSTNKILHPLSSQKIQLETLENQPCQLKLSEYGLLDNLSWQLLQRRSPEAGEVEIQVKAVGLNFRDVLNALGLLKDYYAEHLDITSADQLTFGFECTGTIAAVGANVDRWQVGDEVMATMLLDGLSSFITTSTQWVMAKPKQMSFTEAATLPLVFLTADYGLQHLAKIQPGERVLIHAAASGIGQAAVQIALLAGAEVFATASPPKGEFLNSMGVRHIMNSQTLEFAEQIGDLTEGKGVDIVLNSLNGEFIDKSFDVLAVGGRFVEIGKLGIRDRQQVEQRRPDAQYFAFDLAEAARKLISSLSLFCHGNYLRSGNKAISSLYLIKFSLVRR